MNALRGILPALYTAYDEEGLFSAGRTRKLVRVLLAAGVHGYFVAGTTGEFLLLSPDERKALAEAVTAEAAGAAPVVVHVGGVPTHIARDLASHAASCGASAIASIPPLYYRHSWADVCSHFEAIAERCPLPLYYYHIPQCTGRLPSPDELELLVEKAGVAGMKYSSTDLELFWWLRQRLRPQFNLLSGPDELMVACALLGADGAIGTSYNFMPGPYLRAWEAIARGDFALAQRWQAVANKAIAILRRYGMPAAGKAVLALQGLACGLARGPLLTPAGERLEAMRAELERIGFFAWAWEAPENPPEVQII